MKRDTAEAGDPKIPAAPSAETFGKYLARVLPAILARVSPGTRSRYSGDVRAIEAVGLAAVPLKRVDTAALEAAVTKWKAKALSPATINSRLALVRVVLRRAVEEKDIGRDELPARFPHLHEREVAQELSDDELSRFFAVVRTASPDLWPLCVLAVETGLAWGDLIDLKRSEVFEEEIRRARQKTGQLSRPPITDRAREALDALPKRDDGRVFPPLSRKVAARQLRKILAAAGIVRKFRFHDCRHTFASRLGRAGVDLLSIKKATGHASVAMVERYARTNDSTRERTLAALQAVTAEPVFHLGDGTTRPLTDEERQELRRAERLERACDEPSHPDDFGFE
ncbi:MAG: tyrosine-type recombinase/integrase [Thermoanaerobaculia bacterium]